MAENVLYYGDNLEIIRRYIDDESVDLVYLDPPFKSNQDYNILFAERNGSHAAAQISPDIVGVNVTFRQAQKAKSKQKPRPELNYPEQ
jgi:16S rRNA G966 N2-methylase RsmD